jgi:hypothetical protein
VPAGTRIVGQQVVQGRHDLLQPVPPPQLQDVGGVVEACLTVSILLLLQIVGPKWDHAAW